MVTWLLIFDLYENMIHNSLAIRLSKCGFNQVSQSQQNCVGGASASSSLFARSRIVSALARMYPDRNIARGRFCVSTHICYVSGSVWRRYYIYHLNICANICLWGAAEQDEEADRARMFFLRRLCGRARYFFRVMNRLEPSSHALWSDRWTRRRRRGDRMCTRARQKAPLYTNT